MRREIEHALIVAAIAFGVFVVDVLVVPDVFLLAPPYAVAILVAAYFASVRLIVGATVLVIVLQLTGALINPPSQPTWPLSLVSLAIIGSLAALLTLRADREKALAEERRRLLAELERRAADQARLLEETRQAQAQTAQSLQAEHRAREQAEEAVRARDDFLAASAHELKTPITNLRGYAQITMRRLEREEAPDRERIRQALQTIDLQSDRLARLVQQLLDIASIEAGQLALYPQEIDLVPLVQHQVDDAQAGTKRHSLGLQAPPSLRAVVDSERIASVVANLLDNAVKFSPPGTPIQVELAAPEPGTVQLCVRDHGPGIAPELRPRLFSRFFQAQTGRPFSGLGLGLYYSRHVVELHGGEIRAEFPADGGSRFLVELPREGPG